MASKILVTTKATMYEERKKQHILAGYRIESEQPMPVNGMCSFVAVKDDPTSEVFE
jgi:hypothetical protein